jgi:cbb3-type cytochrome c oxidase subunit III
MMWGAVACLVVVAACAKKEAAENTASDTATTAAAPAPAETTPAAPTAALPAGVTQDQVTQGDQVFHGKGNCYTCHGADAKGTALAPNLTDAEWLNIGGTYDEIVTTVHTGVAKPKKAPAPMPAMGGATLSDDEVKQVAAYVWSLGGGKQ